MFKCSLNDYGIKGVKYKQLTRRSVTYLLDYQKEDADCFISVLTILLIVLIKRQSMLTFP